MYVSPFRKTTSMKRKIVIAFVAVIAALAAFNAKMSLDAMETKNADMTTLVAIGGEFDNGEGDGEIIDGGELPGGGITCDTGGSGTCYAKRVTVIAGTDYCKFYCEATGNPDDYCNSFWQGLIEFCVNYM